MSIAFFSFFGAFLGAVVGFSAGVICRAAWGRD